MAAVGKERGGGPYYRRSDPAAAQWRRPSSLCRRRPALPAAGSSSGAEEAKLPQYLLRDKGTPFGVLAAATNRSPKRACRRYGKRVN